MSCLNPKILNRSCYNFLLGHPVHHYWCCCDCASCYKRDIKGSPLLDSQQKGIFLLPLPLSRIFVICPRLNCRRLNINWYFFPEKSTFHWNWANFVLCLILHISAHAILVWFPVLNFSRLLIQEREQKLVFAIFFFLKRFLHDYHCIGKSAFERLNK